MKSKKAGIGIALALGMTSQGYSQSQDQVNDKSSTQNQVIMDSINLEKRLLELSRTKYTGNLSMGAMCYKVAAPRQTDYTCSHCRTVTRDRLDNWQVRKIRKIESIVNQIRNEGYDVILDATGFCRNCTPKEPENPELIFRIRFSDQSGYHTVRSNIVNEYQCLLLFIQGKEKYPGGYGEEYAIHDQIHIIRKMTGLGTDIVIKDDE